MALIKCPECGKEVSDKAQNCIHCGFPINETATINDNANNSQTNVPKHTFNGIYRYTLLGKKEVHCPRCKSDNCSHYKEKKVIPGKTKTKYSANLNPLKPFTLVNKKEKVVRKDFEYTQDKIICNNCGKIFK